MSFGQRLRSHAARFQASGRTFIGAVAVVGIVVVAVGVFAVRDLRSNNRLSRQMYERSMTVLDLLNQLQYQTQEARRSVLYALTTDDSNRQVEYADQSRAADAIVETLIDRYREQATGH